RRGRPARGSGEGETKKEGGLPLIQDNGVSPRPRGGGETPPPHLRNTWTGCVDFGRCQPGLERGASHAIRARARRCRTGFFRAAGVRRRPRRHGSDGGRGGQNRNRRRPRHPLTRGHPPPPPSPPPPRF